MQHPTRLVATAAASLVLASAAGANTGLASQASQALGLADADLVQVRLVGEPGSPSSAFFAYGGTTVELQLTPDSPFAPDFQLLEDRGDGVLVAVTPEDARTFHGTVAGLPGSLVAASWLDDGLYARVRLSPDADGSDDFWIQPLQRSLIGAAPGQHVLYSTDAILDHGKSCGLDLLANPRPSIDLGGAGGGSTEAAGFVAELALDADYEYFLDYGSSTAVQGQIGAVIATMNMQYETEVDIEHQITAIVVRTTSNDPYSSTNASTLLNQFVSEWNNNQGSIQRDVAQLFTGKEVDGGTIGIAYLGVICNGSFGYGLVQSDFNGNFACATDLSAHELGHNWDADHCSCTSNTMNPFITCANTFSTTLTRPEIIAHRDSRTCLDSGGDPPPDPTSVHVAAIVPGTLNIGKGQKNATAAVTIVDDQGNPVAGAVVTGTFSGPDYSGTVNSLPTNGNGVATLTSSGSAKGKISFTFCVDAVSASLPYDSAGNVETCDSL